MSIVLDVAIGVVFLFSLLALLVTTVQELIATAFGWRSSNLYNAIESMLKGTFNPPAATEGEQTKAAAAKPAAPLDLVTQLYQHPLITNLVRCPSKLKDGLAKLEGRPNIRELSSVVRKNLPSYIPSKTFAIALFDILRGPNAGGTSATELLKGAYSSIESVNDPDLKRVLSLFVEKATATGEQLEKQLDRIRDGVEEWFNDRMARASGWYKRRAQIASIIIAGIVVVVFNADTIHVATRLWKDRALRDSVVATAAAFKPAEGAAGSSGAQEQLEKLKAQSDAILNAGFPIGWTWVGSSLCARLAEPDPASTAAFPSTTEAQCWDASAGDRALLVIGWLITALACCLGANFWFDVLGKALQLRGSGPKISPSSGELEKKT
ncbi:MAG TPA: hypothetical protein VER11_01170 [Polyangiaceae bacterium]|nr:hypothetical protein [Polyangiaceae bacterium]